VNSAVGRCRVYDPAAINIMGRAFDKAFEGLSVEAKSQLTMRRNLALCIIRLFDEGENNSLCISRLALAVLTSPPKARGQLGYLSQPVLVS